MNPIIKTLRTRDNMSLTEAKEFIADLKADWEATGSNPNDLEDILHDDLGLEPDFVFDLADLFGLEV